MTRCRAARFAWEERHAQATVEMAIVTPVLLVVALISYNLMQFVSATARFDRVAPDVVVAHGVAPAGEERNTEAWDAAQHVQSRLAQAMAGCDVDVEVTVDEEEREEAGELLSLVGSLRTYRCVMKFKPWPGNWSIAGVSLGAPFELTHMREVTVDPWRSGVIV